jgi:hypothetical protein
VRSWFKSYGFATLVLVALADALWIAANVAVPAPVPDFALQAEEIYRLEIGAAFFIAFYLVAMAFVLALGGRGFAELGTKGLRAETIVERATNGTQQAALARQRKIDRQTRESLRETRAFSNALQAELKAHARRLERLEERH